MSNIKLFRLALIGAALVHLYVFSPAYGQQQQDEPSAAAIAVNEVKKAESKTSGKANAETKKEKELRPERTSAAKLNADKITSFFVRDNDSNRIQLSMLVAYKAELAQSVRAIVGQRVTPLVFSISTLPNRIVSFDPAQLRFEQKGRIWKPETGKQSADVMALEENGVFGGKIADGEIHQGVILLPAWFDPQAPITLRYGDFHYLAKFALLEK